MATTAFDFCGNCSLGLVTDERLRVYNIKGFCVAELSVIPNVIDGGLVAPVIFIANKAADMIRKDN